jgi:hypothetical protein
MSRYINASDISKLLGREYGFFWSTTDDIRRILKCERNDKDPVKDTLSLLTKEDLVKTAEALGCIPNVEKIMKVLEKKKMKITDSGSHSEYTDLTCSLVDKLPSNIGNAIVDDFCLQRGVSEESKILESRNIKKDNKLRYLNFKVENQWYKIGCRFDGPQVEIKTRKSKFLGVPDYEKVQIHIYMAVAGCGSWTLIEKYNDQEVDHSINFDTFFFDKVKNDLHQKWESNLCSLNLA